jgi:hypothetical protein
VLQQQQQQQQQQQNQPRVVTATGAALKRVVCSERVVCSCSRIKTQWVRAPRLGVIFSRVEASNDRPAQHFVLTCWLSPAAFNHPVWWM